MRKCIFAAILSHGIAAGAALLGGCEAHEAPSPATPATAVPQASATPAALVAPAAPVMRLPDTVRPISYEVALTVVPVEERFEGRITIPIEVRASTSLVWLNATGLDVRAVTVDGVAAKVLPGGEDFIGIQSARPLPVGRATVVLDYAGEISSKEQTNLFREKDGERWYAFTDFEPVGARHVFPCFDEPSFKVPWKLRLKVKPGDLAFSNAPQLSETVEGGYKVVQFAETKPLPSYLVAFGVGPFDAIDAGPAGKNHVPVRIIVPHDRGREARFAKEVTPGIVDRLEDYFGIPYPYEKLDIIDVPGFAGAMENAGLVTFMELLLLSVPEKETLKFQRDYTDFATHELAHQWFGDLVTTAWWDDLWLNEGFANWTTNRILEDWKPDWHKETERVLDTATAMRVDGLLSARQVRQPIADKSDILNAFDDITYKKGAAVIDMFENWIGRDHFRAGVHRYLTKYAHGNATSEQFLAAVFERETAASKNAAIEAFGTFLNQPGLPLVTATLKCDSGKTPTLSLSQERYLPAGSDGKSDLAWQIPVCARYPGQHGIARSCALLSQTRGELPLGEASSCPAWVNANADGHGYYRVLYGGELLAKLLSPATHDGKDLTRAEKVALLSDLAALVRTTKISYADVLRVLPKLASDPVNDVAASTLDMVENLEEGQLFAASLRSAYARFVRDVYGARAKKLGFAPRPGEDADAGLLRGRLLLLVADRGEDPALRREAKALALRWLHDRKGVDPSMVDAVLNLAAQNGDRALFDRMVAAARASKVRLERDQILWAMGSFRDPELLKAALGLTLSDAFDVRESFWMVRRAQNTSPTREIVYDFVKRNYDALAARLPDDSRPSKSEVPDMIGKHFCDDAHAADLDGFFHDRLARVLGGPRVLAQTVEAVKLCSATRALQEPNVSAFLQKK